MKKETIKTTTDEENNSLKQLKEDLQKELSKSLKSFIRIKIEEPEPIKINVKNPINISQKKVSDQIGQKIK